MSTFVHSFSSRHVLCIDHNKYETIRELKSFLADKKGISLDACFLICNGGIVKDDDPVLQNVVYHTYLRIPGGKGGFGSMLRAIGAQIEKTTNHEACRDLSGRRMRDVNNEKDLKEWLAKQSEREKAREERRQERLARRRAMPQHKFSDPLYDQQRSLLAENQEDALQKGLQKFVAKPGTSATVTSEQVAGTKRKQEKQGSGTSKKKTATEWLGVDIEDISDLDSEEDGSSSDSQNAPVTMETPATSSSEESIQEGESTLQCLTHKTDNPVTGESESIVKSEQSDQSDSKDEGSSEKCVQSSESKTGNDTDLKHVKQEDEAVGTVEVKKEQPEMSLEEALCAQDLESLGLDRLKQELMHRGLKCGGTLEQRAQRLFSVKGLTRDQIDPSLFSKAANGKKVKNRT